jgi:hypothetical protein
MSTFEDTDSQPRTEHGQSIDNGPKVTSTEGPLDVATAIDQLRTLVCGLGVGLLVVSLALTAFVYKQNRDLVAGIALHEQQIARLQANERLVNPVVNALIQYSAGKPELMGVLARHGLQVNPTSASTQPPP